MTSPLMHGRPITAIWVHGNAVIPEQPSDFREIRRRGWGTELLLRPGEGSPAAEVRPVVHIAVPTPVLFESDPADLVRIFLLYETNGPDVQIQQLDLWDGPDAIPLGNAADLMLPPPLSDQHWHGSHIIGLDPANTVSLTPKMQPIHVRFGLGLSFHCYSAIGGGTLYIAAAGADFLTSLHVDPQNPVRGGQH